MACLTTYDGDVVAGILSFITLILILKEDKTSWKLPTYPKSFLMVLIYLVLMYTFFLLESVKFSVRSISNTKHASKEGWCRRE